MQLREKLCKLEQKTFNKYQHFLAHENNNNKIIEELNSSISENENKKYNKNMDVILYKQNKNKK